MTLPIERSNFNYGSGRFFDAYKLGDLYVGAAPIPRYVIAVANDVPKKGKLLSFPASAKYFLQTESIYISDVGSRPTVWVEIIEQTGRTTAYEIVTSFTGVIAEIPRVILFPGVKARVYHDANTTIPGIYFKLSPCDVLEVMQFEAIP